MTDKRFHLKMNKTTQELYTWIGTIKKSKDEKQMLQKVNAQTTAFSYNLVRSGNLEMI